MVCGTGSFEDEIMPLDCARFYSACIVSTFGAIHRQHIIYRDLKTENLLLDRAGFLKVPSLPPVDPRPKPLARHISGVGTFSGCDRSDLGTNRSAEDRAA